MLTLFKIAGFILLFLLVFAAIRLWLNAGWSDRRAVRLHKAGISRKYHVLDRHLTVLLQTANWKMNRAWFYWISAIAGSAGIAAGSLFFSSVKGVLAAGGLLGLLPYFWLRSRLITLQFRHRIDFLPAVEIFYQAYVLSETKNIRSVLKASVEGDRMPLRLQHLFQQLHASLMVHSSVEEALNLFRFGLGNRWADHFAAMLRYALENGADLSEGLRELIADMRRALRSDQAERNRLLEIRIANFSPLLFLFVFLAINFKIDPQQAYEYYVLSDAGKAMLLDALILIFASFAMGLYLSMRKI